MFALKFLGLPSQYVYLAQQKPIPFRFSQFYSTAYRLNVFLDYKYKYYRQKLIPKILL